MPRSKKMGRRLGLETPCPRSWLPVMDGTMSLKRFVAVAGGLLPSWVCSNRQGALR